jgi:hypothetical protein
MASLAFITLCDYACVLVNVCFAFLLINASKRETASLTRSFTVATFLSTCDRILASCNACVVGVKDRFANASVSILFFASRSVTCVPIAFRRFCRACARDRAVGPVRAAASTSFRRFYCASWSRLNVLRIAKYSLHFESNWSVICFAVWVQAFSKFLNRSSTAVREVFRYCCISFTAVITVSNRSFVAPV